MRRGKPMYDVAVCGAGPVGLLLTHLLASSGHKVVLIERNAAPVTEPRAIAIDSESLRALQALDLLQGVEDDILFGIEATYVNAAGTELFRIGGKEPQPYGYPVINSFDQPTLDRFLWTELDARTDVHVLMSHELKSFEQKDSGVSLTVTAADEGAVTLQAKYLVGCDGARSTVRELLGVRMQGESQPFPWLVIDTVNPDFDHGYTCRFFCDPARPGMTLKKKHGERRWEWMLMPGETPEQLLSDARIRDLIAPHTDPERVNIYRKRVYRFHAVMADSWRIDRVFLAGDAAHLTPPFAGQGLNSGFRDVRNLAWKLSGVLDGGMDPRVLDSYETERRPHAQALIQAALDLGAQIQPTEPEAAAARDAHFEQLRLKPDALAEFQDDLMRSVKERVIEQGLICGDSEPRGQLLLQPRVNTASRHHVLLDETLGDGFCVLGYDCDPESHLSGETLSAWQALGLTTVAVAPRGQGAEGSRIEDAFDVLRGWFGSDSPRMALLRPDRFCMTAFALEDGDSAMQEALALLR